MAIDYWDTLPPWQIGYETSRVANILTPSAIGPHGLSLTQHNFLHSSWNYITASASRRLRNVELACFEAIVRRNGYGLRPFKDRAIYQDGTVAVVRIVIVGGAYNVQLDGSGGTVSCTIQLVQGQY